MCNAPNSRQSSTATLLNYEGVPISPYPDILPDVVGQNRWKEGSVHVPNSETFLVKEAKREHAGDARDFNKMETRAVIKFFFFLQGKATKEIHAILRETLGEHAPSYATAKNWVAQFKRGDFSTCVAPRPERPKIVATPEIIDQIHELILEDHWVSSIAEQLGILHEWVGSIIHEDLDMRKLSAKWVPKFLNAGQKRQRC